MDYTTPLAGYLLLVGVIMFGGRQRRTFAQASHAAAGTVVGLLFLVSLFWFLGCAFITSQVDKVTMTVGNRAGPQSGPSE